jgi:hypothetical protein
LRQIAAPRRLRKDARRPLDQPHRILVFHPVSIQRAAARERRRESEGTPDPWLGKSSPAEGNGS